MSILIKLRVCPFKGCFSVHRTELYSLIVLDSVYVVYSNNSQMMLEKWIIALNIFNTTEEKDTNKEVKSKWVTGQKCCKPSEFSL